MGVVVAGITSYFVVDTNNILLESENQDVLVVTFLLCNLQVKFEHQCFFT